MNSANAMERLLAGYRMCRKDWGRTLFVYKGTLDHRGVYINCLMIEMRDGTVGVYTPTQRDIFGDDWEQVQ